MSTIPRPPLKPLIPQLPPSKTIAKAGLHLTRLVYHEWASVYNRIETVNLGDITAIEIANDSEVGSVIIKPGGFQFPSVVTTDANFKESLDNGDRLLVGTKRPWLGRLNTSMISLLPTNALFLSDPGQVDGARLALNVWTGEIPPMLGGARDPYVREFWAGAGQTLFSRKFTTHNRSWFEASIRVKPVVPDPTTDAITVTWIGVSTYRSGTDEDSDARTLRTTTYPAGSGGFGTGEIREDIVSDCPYDYVAVTVSTSGAQSFALAGRLVAHDE